MLNPEDIVALASFGTSLTGSIFFGEHARGTLNPENSLSVDMARNLTEIMAGCMVFMLGAEAISHLEGLSGAILAGVLLGINFGLPLHGGIDMAFSLGRANHDQ